MKNNKIKAEIYNGFWKREEVYRDNTSLYLFGENLDYSSGNRLIPSNRYSSHHVKKFYIQSKYPNSTQAVIRGLNNAIPIITKKGKNKDEFFDNTEEDLKLFKKCNSYHIGDLIEIYNKGFHINNTHHIPDTVQIPKDGFASGRSRLPLNMANYLKELLNDLFVDKNEKEIKFNVVENPYINHNDNISCKDWYSIIPTYA